MKALVFTEYGPIDVLRFKDVEIPTPGDNEVLVRVHAASLNDWDVGHVAASPFFMRLSTGLLRPKSTMQIPGCDVAGTIEAIGANVDRFKPGDEVFGDLCVSGFGSFAEYVCTSQNALAHKPGGMTFAQAASIPQAAQLAVQGLIDTGKLRSGQKLLINGAGGGVGTFGVQIAKLIGAEVTVVDSSIKLDMLRDLGADHVIDYQKEDFTRNGERYDLIVDTKTNRSALDYMRALSTAGIYATVGGSMLRMLQGLLLKPWISLTSKKQFHIVGLRANRDLPYVNELFSAGKLVPVIDGPYQFSEIHDALRVYENAEQKGKVIVTMERNHETL